MRDPGPAIQDRAPEDQARDVEVRLTRAGLGLAHRLGAATGGLLFDRLLRILEARHPRAFAAFGELPADARLRDVVEVVRADEAHHRDVNHGFANELAGGPEARPVPAAWPHEELVPQWKQAA